jgi:NAD(P)-dependent dehydrogenase (short-subunit alcohol dehydrogenase family)
MTGSAAGTTIITGAASGIGAVLARRLATPGARMLLHTRRNLEQLLAVAAAAREAGAEVLTITADLADADGPARIVDAAAGPIAALVANAGFADRTPFGQLDAARFAASLDPIARGFFGLAHAALPLLVDGGRIVAVSSFVAHAMRAHVPQFPASAAAKAAVEAMVRSLAIELAPRGITVNAVAPGFVRKDSGAHAALDPERWQTIGAAIPLSRIGEPAEIAAAIAFLLSDDAGYITGQVLHVDGGLCI